jgi:high affinity sulfate transporter 1
MSEIEAKPPAPQNTSLPQAPTTLEKWFPIAVWLPKYDWGRYVTADLIAALSVGALLIPESMGYASVAGLPVEIGLYAAPLALIGYAMFGGSRLLVAGTIGSVAAITGSILMALGLSGGAMIVAAAALALAAGIIFLVAGLLRLGWVTNFLSRAVLEGFVLGMAIQIIVGQLDELTGVAVTGENTIARFINWITQVFSWDVLTAAVGIGSFLLILLLARYLPKVPAALTAVVLGSLIVAVFSPSIAVVERIPQGLPALVDISGITLSDWATLLLGGALVALIAFSEGWGASAGLARTTHDRLNSNQEFVAYGVANLGAGLLGGMPVGGSLSKSSAAVAAGAKSQMSNIFLAVLVLLTLIFLAPLFQWLPEAVLAAIVIHAMSHSANPKKLQELWSIDRIDGLMGIITALLVLTLDLLPAMIIGIVMSLVYLVFRISFPTRAELGRDEAGNYVANDWLAGARAGRAHPDAQPVPGSLIYRFSAPLIFSNAESFLQSGEDLLIKAAAEDRMPQALIVDMEEMIYMDTTGVEAVANLHDYVRRYGVTLKLARAHSATYSMLQASGLLEEIGPENVHATVDDAVMSTGVAA